MQTTHTSWKLCVDSKNFCVCLLILSDNVLEISLLLLLGQNSVAMSHGQSIQIFKRFNQDKFLDKKTIE